jgi:transcriptional regulator with PAS, ATPase and Fis domain
VGPTDSTVLITGESGTGKELVARAIHRHSERQAMSFIIVDCSTLVENLFESELFGHVKGSFTGATATKHGRLELANGGTVFLDEIGNISPTVQAKLLRAIQEREITKVGSTQSIQIDVRLIAATNVDLMQSVKEGQFREDLFYRLSVVPLHLPPLRERKDDIPVLVNYFLDKYNKRRKKSIRGISDRAMETIMTYDWPGNVRELENAVERAVVLTNSEFIQPSDLTYYSSGAQEEPFRAKTIEEVEKEHIVKTLEAHDGHKMRTAETLGIDRKTLRLKMRKYGILE